MNRSTPIYIFCVHSEMTELILSLGFKHVQSLTLNEPVVVGSLRIIPRRALDHNVDSIFHIQGAGLNILNVVDSWIDEETMTLLKQSVPWDMVLWPFQAMREIEELTPSRYADRGVEIPPEWDVSHQLSCLYCRN